MKQIFYLVIKLMNDKKTKIKKYIIKSLYITVYKLY